MVDARQFRPVRVLAAGSERRRPLHWSAGRAIPVTGDEKDDRHRQPEQRSGQDEMGDRCCLVDERPLAASKNAAPVTTPARRKVAIVAGGAHLRWRTSATLRKKTQAPRTATAITRIGMTTASRPSQNRVTSATTGVTATRAANASAATAEGVWRVGEAISSDCLVPLGPEVPAQLRGPAERLASHTRPRAHGSGTQFTRRSRCVRRRPDGGAPRGALSVAPLPSSERQSSDRPSRRPPAPAWRR